MPTVLVYDFHAVVS